jgi:hypothetical protein
MAQAGTIENLILILISVQHSAQWYMLPAPAIKYVFNKK